MAKKLLIILLLMAIAVPACLVIAVHFSKPHLEYKVLELANVYLGEKVGAVEVDIRFFKGTVTLRRITVTECKFFKYRNWGDL